MFRVPARLLFLLCLLEILLQLAKASWVYQGCYRDDPLDRAFPIVVLSHNENRGDYNFPMSMDSCKDMARSINATILGYEEQGECWVCPSDQTCLFHRHGKADQCKKYQNKLKLHVFAFDEAVITDECDESYPYDCDLAAGKVDLARVINDLISLQKPVFDRCESLFEEVILDKQQQRLVQAHDVPRHIPQDFILDFSMNYSIHIIEWYEEGSSSANIDNQIARWNATQLVESHRNNYCFTIFPFQCKLLENDKNFVDEYIRGKRGAVFGSQFPWLEASFLLNFQASHVTTIEFFHIVSMDIDSLTTLLPSQAASLYLAGGLQLFDFAASFSSFEHTGLGRYGDKLDPFGDLKAMSMVHCMLKEGGILLLEIPIGIDTVYFNAHRVYGKRRLPYLLAGWEVIRVYGTFDINNPVNLITESSILVLKKVVS